MKRKLHIIALLATLGALLEVPLQSEASKSIPIEQLRILAETGDLGMPHAANVPLVRPARAYVTPVSPVRVYARPVRRTQGERVDVTYPTPQLPVGG